ncbi:DNA helicase [Tanacetum coccineum]
MCPEEGQSPRFLQLYIYDTTNEVKNRLSHFNNEHESALKEEIVEGLIQFLDNHNALVQLFRTARNKYMDADIPEFKVRLYNVIGTRQYELPTAETIGAIVFGDSSATENEFDLIVEEHSRFPQRLVQPALFTHTVAIEQSSSMITFLGKYIDDIRSEYLSGIYDAILRGDRDGSDLGLRTVLTASFTGSPRYMYAHYLDALAICRVHGSPSFFITFTCNANWPEIVEFMKPFPQLTTADRADIVDRIFEKKVRDYIDFVRDSKTFGDVTAVLYTIEFQKRGLPHCHSLLWIAGAAKVQKDVDVDKYVCAELPDPVTDPNTFAVISELMIHGPCGVTNPSATCMKDDGDLFYLRTLLCHQKGCTSFTDIRKINNNIYSTNKAACQAFGLLSDDEEWVTALQEASAFATAPELRRLFVYMLIFCSISDPVKLWEKIWKDLSDDVPRNLSKTLRIPHIQKNEKKLKASTLLNLEHLLNSYSKSLDDFGLPMPTQDMLLMLQNRLLIEETNYDAQLLNEEKNFLIPRLNKDQRFIFNEITEAVRCNVQKLIFVYGHGGTEKTFLWKAITSALRSEEKIVLTVAASGIAALLLPSADLLRQTDLIIWDEAPMNDRWCFEALDRTLKDISNSPNTLFGGKSIILGGDFRQTLPVKKKASKAEILDASITSSYLWPKFKTYILMENMMPHQSKTIEAESVHIQKFSTWLLDIGDGAVGDPDETDNEKTFNIHIPPELCITDSNTALATLIDFIYDQKALQAPSAKDLQKKAIVCPKNEDADMINAQVLSLVNHQQHVYLSLDEATPHGNDGGETELLYPPEYLNSLTFAGFPPHKL